MNMGINFGNITDPETLKLIFIILDIFIISGWIVAFLIVNLLVDLIDILSLLLNLPE